MLREVLRTAALVGCIVSASIGKSAATAAPTLNQAGDPTVIVRYSDLDLASPVGRKALEHRIRNASRQVCGESSLGLFNQIQAACRQSALRGARPQMLAAIERAADPQLASASVPEPNR